MRRLRRLVKPAATGASVIMAVILVVSVIRSTVPGGMGHESLAGLRETLGDMTASLGLRVSQDVVIEGRANTPEPLLRAAIGISPGDPILGFSLEKIRADVERLSWVEHATVERRLPGLVVVSLQERRPFAIWQNQGKFQLVDRTGQVVNQDISQFRKLPLIVGIGAPAAASVILDLLTDRPSLGEKVSASVRIGERRWNLHLTNGTDVLLPEGHEKDALDRLIQLERDHALLDRPMSAIDMRLPDRLVLRPKADSKDADTAAPVPVISRKPA
jgi:cell division protein FtsQ